MVEALGDPIDILRFAIGGHRYALRLDDVRELVRAVAVSPLPDAPSSVLGTIDVRGARVPLYDLRARLGLSPAPLRARDVMVLVGGADRPAAIVVDEAFGIERVAPAAIDPADLRFATPPLLAGVVTLDEGTRLLFDLEAFLTETERTVLDAALSAVAADTGRA